jgi:hypothetical protein
MEESIQKVVDLVSEREESIQKVESLTPERVHLNQMFKACLWREKKAFKNPRIWFRRELI